MDLLIAILIIFTATGLYIWEVYKNYKKKRLKPKNNNELILEKVENIKKIATENKIHEKVLELYDITSPLIYNEKIQQEYDPFHFTTIDCSLIEKANKIPQKSNGHEVFAYFSKYYLKLKSRNTFIFVYTKKYSGYRDAYLELLFNNKRVAQIFVDDYLSKALHIEAYIDGEWVAILEDLLITTKNEKEEKQKQIDKAEEEGRINKLKEDFGLE